jgi:RING finger family protein
LFFNGAKADRMSTPSPSAAGSALCAFCQTQLAAGEPREACPDCRAEYHVECWQENGGCAVYGCSKVPAVEPRGSLEIPVSYWGQENKPCPSCGREILAAAVRCRHCGATFTSAQPENREAFRQRADLEQRLPRLQKQIVWIFIACVLPCLAPIGAVLGLIWYANRREELNALPSLYPALCRIGLWIAASQTLILLLMAIFYSLLRHR